MENIPLDQVLDVHVQCVVSDEFYERSKLFMNVYIHEINSQKDKKR